MKHELPVIRPFSDLRKNYYEQDPYEKYVAGKLAEAEEYAARPDAVWHKFDDVAREMRQGL